MFVFALVGTKCFGPYRFDYRRLHYNTYLFIYLERGRGLCDGVFGDKSEGTIVMSLSLDMMVDALEFLVSHVHELASPQHLL